jgi:hypothetical protein
LLMHKNRKMQRGKGGEDEGRTVKGAGGWLFNKLRLQKIGLGLFKAGIHPLSLGRTRDFKWNQELPRVALTSRGWIYHKLIYAYFKERYSITLLKLSYHVKCNQATPLIILTNDNFDST